MEKPMPQKLISIIIPVYNVEQYLDRCIESVVQQTYKNIQVILVDDGSTDKSGKMCDEWAKNDKRITVIHKKNGGLSSARNAGIQKATGDYIGFVDSDDWISLDMYRTLFDLCEKYNADIACGEITPKPDVKRSVKNSGVEIKQYSSNEYAKKYFKIGSQKTVHYAVNKLYKSQVAKKIIYPVGLIDEDVEGFAIALINSERIVTTSKIVYYYWQNEKSISYHWFTEKQLDLITIWNDVCQLCESEKPEWLQYAKYNYQKSYFALLCRLAFNDPEEDKKYKETEKYLIKNMKTYEKALLRSEMPFIRKGIMFCMCRNYQLTKKVIRAGKKFYSRRV